MYTETLFYPDRKDVFLEACILNSGLRLGQSTKRPAVIVCPGGGYVYLSPREGEPVAAAYAAKGFQTFVLHYSVGWAAAGFAPLQELSWAIGTVRSHAEEWNVAEEKIFVCGFSAGGHLALAGGLLGENRPNGLILGYPAVNLASNEALLLCSLLTGKQGLTSLSGLTEEEQRWMTLPAQVTKDAPPLFVFTTAEDAVTCRSSLELVNAYTALGLPCEFHLFQKGPHGYALANAATADGSSQVLNPQVETWLDLSAAWILSVTGGLQFGDCSTSRIMDAIRALGIPLPGQGDGAAHA